MSPQKGCGVIWFGTMLGIVAGAFAGYIVAWRAANPGSPADSMFVDNPFPSLLFLACALVTIPLGMLFGAMSSAALAFFWVWASDAREETGA